MIDIGIEKMQSVTIEDLLKQNKVYRIPHFQREYSWKKDEWSDLLEDILISKEKNNSHFFGFMTFKNEKNSESAIIEGQQRLATVTIFLAVIRDIYFEKNDIYGDSVEKYIITKDDLSPDEPPTPKIILSDLNEEFFFKYIQTKNKPKEKLDQYDKEKSINLSNKILFDCYKYYYSEISNKIQKYSDAEQKEYLRDLVKSLLRKFGVITTEVKNENVAYNIFQTLNNRGLDLTITDLLKVYFFDKVGSNWPEAKEKWDDIREALSTINMNTFLRHYWLSSERVVKEKDLLGEIQEKYKSKHEVFKFLDELKEEAFVYEALLNPREDYWNIDVVESLKDLQILSTQQTLPLLMAAAQKFNSSDLISLINYCTTFVFRYLTIMEKENKVLEKMYSDIAIEIRRGDITSAAQVRERLKKEDVDDSVLRPTLMEKEFKVAKVSTYMLKKIEFYLDPGKEKWSNKITLEHVLPRNPDKEWIEFMKKHKMEKDDFVNKLGNLTLLIGNANRQAQNKFFIHKKEKIYSKMSILKLNDYLCDVDKWSKTEIITRQEILIDIIMKVWKL